LLKGLKIVYNEVREVRSGMICHPSTNEEIGQIQISTMVDWALASLTLPLHSPFQKYLNFMDVVSRGAFLLVKFRETGKQETEFMGLQFFWTMDCDEQKVGIGCELLDKLDNLQVFQMVGNKRLLGLRCHDSTQIEGYTDEHFMNEWDRTKFKGWPYE
jgi:hypothetical protein